MKEDISLHNLKSTPFSALLLSGDEAALKSLYVAHYPGVKNWLLQNGGQEADAADIYQEAFLATWRNISAGKYAPVSAEAAGGYIFSVARHKWIDRLRAQQKMHTVHVAETELPETAAMEDPQPERKLHTVQQQFRLLGAECRDLLLRVYFSKQSLREVASALNITEASARNKKYRCMERLRAAVLSKTDHHE